MCVCVLCVYVLGVYEQFQIDKFSQAGLRNVGLLLCDRCDHCSFRTGDKSHLTKHLRSHGGKKPFACAFCDYRSAAKSDLTKHEKTHTRKVEKAAVPASSSVWYF